MEKRCPKCGRKFKDLKFKVCPICTVPLEEIEGRIPFSNEIREKVFKRDGYRCVKCGAHRNDKNLQVDHIIPVSQGGTNDIDNLQTLCWECNLDKGNNIPESGLKYDIEIKENELKNLNKLIQKYKDKLKTSTNEEDKIEYAFQIKKLEKEIPKLSQELTELKIKFQEEQNRTRKAQEEKKRKELLFKKLFVELSPMEILVLKEHFNLTNLSDEDMLKALCEEHSKKEIMNSIDVYKTDLHQFIEGSIKFNMLNLISTRLSLNNSSKQYIVNHLYTKYSKSQIKDLFKSVTNELLNQYNSSFNIIEKTLLKRHYMLNDVTDEELINYVIEQDFSIDDLKNTIEIAYKNVFHEFYNKLNDYQKYLVKYGFDNSKKNFVNFLANNNFSEDSLKDKLDKFKVELFNKTYNSLTNYKKSLIERYSKKYSENYNLMDYFYKNKFSMEKIDELIEISKKDLIKEIHQKLNNHEMFLLENTFSNDEDIINFMIKNNFLFDNLLNKLLTRKNEMCSKLDESLNDKQKFLLKKHYSINDDKDLIDYLVKKEYSLNDTLVIVNDYYKQDYKEFDDFINFDYEQILYGKFELKKNSKKELIDYLIYNDYTLESIRSLIKSDMFDKYSAVLDLNYISLLCYKFKLVTATKISNIPLKEYLFNNNYPIQRVNKSVQEAKKELYDELDNKIDYRAVDLLNKEFKLNKSKNELINHLIDNYTVETIRDSLKKYHINI